MSSFFEKLMLARQISFKEGRIEYLGNSRLMLLSEIFLSMYTESMIDSKEELLRLYRNCKEDMRDRFVKKITKSHGNTSRESMLGLLKQTAEFGGWGIFEYESVNENEHRVIFKMMDGIVSSALKGKVKRPCDHIFRGIAAGGMSVMFNSDVDCIELSCIAIGDPFCRLVIGNREFLEKEFPEKFREQM